MRWLRKENITDWEDILDASAGHSKGGLGGIIDFGRHEIGGTEYNTY